MRQHVLAVGLLYPRPVTFSKSSSDPGTFADVSRFSGAEPSTCTIFRDGTI